MNKKYLKTKEGSIEDAVLGALRVETPENPNSYRPTLTLPKKKYLETKEGSIEQAVENALTEAGATKKQVRMAKGIANDPRHKGGDMTGAWKKAEKIKKGLGDHPKVAAALRKANEEEEIGEAPYAAPKYVAGLTDKEISGAYGKKALASRNLRRKTQQAARDKRKAETGYTRHGGSRAKKEEISTDEIENMIRFGKAFVVGEKKEVDVPDTRRTVDAIRAYDKSKDASRDADYDTSHGKAKKGDIEKKYAKKERGEIDKDDPRWKHRDYHTGIHGEEVENESKRYSSADVMDREFSRPGANVSQGKPGKRKHGGVSGHFGSSSGEGKSTTARLQHIKDRGRKKVRGAKEEVETTELSPLMKATIDELSKKTMGSYVKKASADAETRMGNLERARGQAAATGQSADVDAQIRAHKPTMARLKSRPKGIARAADKLSKEEVETTELSPLIRATVEKVHSMREDKLSYKERQGLPKGDFALPGKGDGPEGKQGGSYPIPDESHARNALARVSQHGTSAEKAKVKAAVEKKFPNIKVSESKETERGERDVGSDKYTDYVAGLTPGQEPDVDVTNKDAKRASSESKKANAERERQIRKIDDEFITHLESLEGDALEAALDGLSPNELLEVLGTGLIKKAAGAVKKRFSAQGRLAAAKKKGAKLQTKTDLATQKTSNIAQKAKLKAAKEKLRAAKKPAAPKPATPAPSKPAASKPKPSKPAPKVKVVPGRGIVSAQYDPED